MEADIIWTTDPADSLAHNPCNPYKDGGCGNSGSGKLEISNILVHELGHVLGLSDLTEAETSQLTMYTHQSTGGSWGDRFKVSLGHGDKLGLAVLYPCGCQLPPTYEP